MLNDYCQNVLRAELQKSDYDGKTNAEAWSWLMDASVPAPVETPNGKLLTPVFVAGVIGPEKANAVAGAVKQAFPFIADQLLSEGMNPANGSVTGFLQQMVGANTITSADIEALHAACVVVTQPPAVPRRFDSRFYPELWPDVDGTGPISGFPNTIERADFDAAWTAAGRN